MEKLRTMPLFQGVYFFITGIWPVVHIDSFLFITGPKTDIWLVKTVGLLILPYSILCFYAAVIPKKKVVVAAVNSMSSLGLAGVDLYYYLKDVIRWVYLIDFTLEVSFLIYWLFYIIVLKNTR